MAADADEVRRAALRELARRELARREQQTPQPQGDDLGRQVGLSARALGQTASDLLNLPFDTAANVSNYFTSKFYPEGYDVTVDGQKVHRSGLVPTLSQQRDEALSGLGLPEPENAMERVANVATRGALGGGGIATAASRLPGALAATLASRPLLQTVSGATGGAAAATAAEHGYGPLGQFGAGLLGGMAPGLVSGVPKPMGAIDAAADASGRASARVGRGTASSETTVSGGAQVTARGGGFGEVGEDPSAGLNSAQRRVSQRGQELGFRTTPGQATGSRALLQLEAKLEGQPMTSGPFNTIKATNQTTINRAAAQAIGIRSDVLDDAALNGALGRMQAVFRDAADEVVRPIDPRGYIEWLGELQNDMRGLVSGVSSHPLIEDITTFAQQGGGTGRQLQSLTHKLGNAAYKQMTTPAGDRDLGIALYRAKDYVDDLLMHGMEEKRLATFQNAREQYRNLMLLTSRTGVINPSSGNVSGVALAAALQAKDRKGFLFGRNRSPMYDAARFAQAFKPIVGDSGTATRSSQTPTDYVISLPFSIATKAYASSPSIRLAVGAQSAARALRNPIAIPQSGELPAVGALAGLTPEERRRRKLVDALTTPTDE